MLDLSLSFFFSLPNIMRYPTNMWSHLSLHPSLLRERQGQARDPRAATLPSGVIQGHLYSDSKTLSEGYYLITSQHYTSDSCTGAGPFCSSPKRHVHSLIFSCSYSSLLQCPLTSSSYPNHSQILHEAFYDCFIPQVKVAQSCPTLCDPLDYTAHGILQARILEWVAVPFSRGSSQPRNRTQVSCIAGRFFTSWATREVIPQICLNSPTSHSVKVFKLLSFLLIDRFFFFK